MRYTLFSVFMTQLILWVLLLFMLFPQEGIFFEVMRLFCATILLFYLPWYWISYIFFSEVDLSAFERFIINFLISFTLVILISYYLYIASSQVSTIKIYLISSIIILISIPIVLIRWRWWVDSLYADE